MEETITTPPKRILLKKLISILIIAVAAYTLYVRDNRVIGFVDAHGAKGTCNWAVYRELEYPKKREYRKTGNLDTAVHMGSHVYRVRSYIDWQNETGETTRTYFYCETKRNKSKQWQILELNLSTDKTLENKSWWELLNKKIHRQ